MASDMMTEDRALFAKALEILRDDIAECEHAAGDCERCNLIRPILSSTAAQEALREREELLANRLRLGEIASLLRNLAFEDRIGRGDSAVLGGLARELEGMAKGGGK